MRPTITVALLTLIALLSIGTASQAAAPGPRAGGQRAGFANRLELTADQIQQITETRKQLMIDIKGVRDSSATRPVKIARVKELVGAASDAVFNILTPEQRDKVAKSVIAVRLLRLPRVGAGGGYFAFLRDLDLTQAQKTQLKSIMQDNAAQMKALRDDTSLTPQQKLAKMKAIRKATLDKIMSMLTPAQREKAKAAIANAAQGATGGQGLRRAGQGAAQGQGLRRAGQGAGAAGVRRERAGRQGVRQQGTAAEKRNSNRSGADVEPDIDASLD